MTARRAARIVWAIVGAVAPLLAGQCPDLVDMLADFGAHTMIRSIGLPPSAIDLYDWLSLL